MMNKYFADPARFVFENILVMKFTPRNPGSHIRSRVTSSLLYVIEGCYRYTTATEVFEVHAGEIVYIPRGAEYTYAVMGESPKCIQVEFDLYRHADGKTEQICFFDRPTLIPAGDEERRLFVELADGCRGNTFLMLSVLYRMMALFFEDTYGMYTGDREREKIRPALEYINRNLHSGISVTDLAAMCGISTSHFRRLFKSLMGKSPVRYKNQLVMKYACRMLESGAMNVSEISNALGFSDIYTFSQTFKKEVGISPSQYASGTRREKRVWAEKSTDEAEKPS